MRILTIKLKNWRSHPMYEDIYSFVLLQVVTIWQAHADKPLPDRWRLARYVMRYCPAVFFRSTACDWAFRETSVRGHPIPRPVPWQQLGEEDEHPRPGERWYQRPCVPDFVPALLERLWREQIARSATSLDRPSLRLLALWLRTGSVRAVAERLGCSRGEVDRRLLSILNDCRRRLCLPEVPRKPAHSPAWYARRRERRKEESRQA